MIKEGDWVIIKTDAYNGVRDSLKSGNIAQVTKTRSRLDYPFVVKSSIVQ